HAVRGPVGNSSQVRVRERLLECGGDVVGVGVGQFENVEGVLIAASAPARPTGTATVTPTRPASTSSPTSQPPARSSAAPAHPATTSTATAATSAHTARHGDGLGPLEHEHELTRGCGASASTGAGLSLREAFGTAELPAVVAGRGDGLHEGIAVVA